MVYCMLLTELNTFGRSAGGLESLADSLMEVNTDTVQEAEQWLGKMSVTSQPLTNNVVQAISMAVGTEGVRSLHTPVHLQLHGFLISM